MEAPKKKYTFAVIAVDVVIFTVRENELKVLLIKMQKPPFENSWAAPGGLVRPAESLDEAAKRLLREKTGVKNVYLEQLSAFGKVDRDPFGRVVSVAYVALIPSANLKLQTTKEHREIAWFPTKGLPKLAYDHAEIIAVALERLQEKLGYTNIVGSLLGKEFTLTELQHVYELILNKRLDKRNFRKKLLDLGLVVKLRRKRRGEANRPAELYHFEKKAQKGGGGG